MRRAGLLLLGVLFLAGCAARAPMPGQAEQEAQREAREARLADWSAWGLTGRLGVEDGWNGGSGRLDWTLREQETLLKFRGAMGQGAWELSRNPAGARLKLADGTEHVADDIDTLVREQTGWRLPVDALAWWVRGLAWPLGPAPDKLAFDADGMPERLEQAGWEIDFRRYQEAGGEQLPTRMEARKGGLTVKLAISRWLPPATD